MLLLSLMLTPRPAAAETPPRYQALLTAVRAQGDIIPEIGQADQTDQDQMLCMALNIYHEIRGGTSRDQWAVGFVTLNRTHHDAFKADTVCDVVWSPGQFSWTRWPLRAQVPHEKAAWIESQHKAVLLLSGEKMNDPTDGSTFFYQARLNFSWTRRLVNKIRIGAHVFASLPGGR